VTPATGIDDLKHRFAERYPDFRYCVEVRIDRFPMGVRQGVRLWGPEWKFLDAKLLDQDFIAAARSGVQMSEGRFGFRRACRGDWRNDHKVLDVWSCDGLLRLEFVSWDSPTDPRSNFSLAQARRELARIAREARRRAP